jgi:hypothetical protein
MCTASVTVSILCTGDANTPSPTVTSTDEIIPHGGDLNITDSPSAVPINPDGGDLNIAKPVANDDYYTTNQDESIEIAILKNDTLIVGKFFVCPTILQERWTQLTSMHLRIRYHRILHSAS